MGTTKEDIGRWLKSARKENATHVIVVCDTYDHEDYPVNVLRGEDPRKKALQYSKGMQRVMEVYALHLDWDLQLAEPRSFHYETAPAKKTKKERTVVAKKKTTAKKVVAKKTPKEEAIANLKMSTTDYQLKMATRANVAIDVYNACQDNSTSFEEDNLGANLVYLMGAILKGERFEAWLGIHEEFINLLREHVGTDHKAWESIDFMVTGEGEDAADVPLPQRIKQALVEGRQPGNLDDEDYPAAGAWVTSLNQVAR